MSIFKELGQMYAEIDSYYARMEFDAKTKGWTRKEKTWARKRELNDHAYFLFMFTRLEDRVREQSSKLITGKQASISRWRQRSAWDILPKEKDSDRLSFRNRLALLAKKGSKDYNRMIDYHDLRNTVGHGGSFSSPVSIPDVVEDFDYMYSVLTI
jgi:hypothetical protein